MTKALGKAGINMHAFSMSETTDFGILRLIVSDVDRAIEVLRAANFSVIETEVICISCANTAGSLSVILERLAEQHIFIEYMYAFAQGDKANVVIRPNDLKRSLEVLKQMDCSVLTAGNL